MDAIKILASGVRLVERMSHLNLAVINSQFHFRLDDLQLYWLVKTDLVDVIGLVRIDWQE